MKDQSDTCKVCGALPDDPCIMKTGQTLEEVHHGRVQAWEKTYDRLYREGM